MTRLRAYLRVQELIPVAREPQRVSSSGAGLHPRQLMALRTLQRIVARPGVLSRLRSHACRCGEDLATPRSRTR